MASIFLGILPPILVFLLGYLLKRIKIIPENGGAFLLRLVFYIALPALIFLSILNLDLSLNLLKIPLIAVLVSLLSFVVIFVVSKFFHLDQSTLGVFIIGPTLLNTSLSIPFILAVFGDEGLALISMFILGNSVVIFTFVYGLACFFGKRKYSPLTLLQKFIVFPILWGIIIALILNLNGLSLPGVLVDLLQILGDLTIPLLMLALGAHLNFKFKKVKLLLSSLGVRYVFGFFFGLVLAYLFNLEGVARIVVLVASASPIGNNVLIFASLEKLDTEFAASLASLSMVTGVIIVPLLIMLLQ